MKFARNNYIRSYDLEQRFPTGGEFPPTGEFATAKILKKSMLNMRQKRTGHFAYTERDDQIS